MQKHYNSTKIRTTLRNVLKGRNIEDSFCLRHHSVQNDSSIKFTHINFFKLKNIDYLGFRRLSFSKRCLLLPSWTLGDVVLSNWTILVLQFLP